MWCFLRFFFPKQNIFLSAAIILPSSLTSIFIPCESPLTSRFIYLFLVKLIESCCRPVAFWQKNYDKTKVIWMPCYCTSNYSASRERSSKALKIQTPFFLQFVKLLRSLVHCSISVFTDKILKYDDVHMHFKSSFKALMDHLKEFACK